MIKKKNRLRGITMIGTESINTLGQARAKGPWDRESINTEVGVRHLLGPLPLFQAHYTLNQAEKEQSPFFYH